MKKRIVALSLCLLLLVPGFSVGAQTPGQSMPPDQSNFQFLTPAGVNQWCFAVLNEFGEVWINYSAVGSGPNYETVLTYLPEKEFCFATGVKEIAATNSSLFVLRENGTLEYWRFLMDDYSLLHTLRTDVVDIATSNSYDILALTEQGDLYTCDGYSYENVPVEKLDSGVAALISASRYVKEDGTAMRYALEELKIGATGLPDDVVHGWQNGGTYYVLTQDGELWGWGDNNYGQLGSGAYDSTGSYFYFGSFTDGVRAVRLQSTKPVKILDDVVRILFDGYQVYALMEDGTYRTWGDGEAVSAYMSKVDGVLHSGEWEYPEGWPNCKGWTTREITVTQWKCRLNDYPATFYSDGTVWVDYSSTRQYVGRWFGRAEKPIYTDVPLNSYYAQPVRWAVEKKVTSGTGSTTFSPNVTCTQAQILTFLWRAAGSPEAAGPNHFSNTAVTAGQYYYEALLWAYENGVVDDLDLNPDAPCTRSDVVTYLWKLEGSPVAESESTFTDVSSAAPYAAAVHWAVKNAITAGTTPTTFTPAATCTRGEIVTFLYRYFDGE